MRIIWVVKASIIAAIYASLVIVLAPISFYAIQVRVADALLILPILNFFGFPCIVGLTIGCIIANLFSPFGLIDIVFGSLTNMITGFIAWIISRVYHKICLKTILLTTTLQSLTVSIIIGYGLLHLLLNEPLFISFTGVFIGSVISICILGSTLVLFMNKRLGIS